MSSAAVLLGKIPFTKMVLSVVLSSLLIVPAFMDSLSRQDPPCPFKVPQLGSSSASAGENDLASDKWGVALALDAEPFDKDGGLANGTVLPTAVLKASDMPYRNSIMRAAATHGVDPASAISRIGSSNTRSNDIAGAKRGVVLALDAELSGKDGSLASGAVSPITVSISSEIPYGKPMVQASETHGADPVLAIPSIGLSNARANGLSRDKSRVILPLDPVLFAEPIAGPSSRHYPVELWVKMLSRRALGLKKVTLKNVTRLGQNHHQTASFGQKIGPVDYADAVQKGGSWASIPVSPITLSIASEVPYRKWILQAAETYGVDPTLIMAVIRAESNYNPRAVSHCGARGLMQIMPTTARYLKVSDPFDPAENVDGGVRYLRQMLDRFNGDERLALAAYNAGAAKVLSYGDVPPYRETRNYIKTVLEYRDAVRSAVTVVIEPSSAVNS
ncbi:MAG: lytic transglycosylase domain-containing protein [Desulfobacteraceae bacterium]